FKFPSGAVGYAASVSVSPAFGSARAVLLGFFLAASAICPVLVAEQAPSDCSVTGVVVSGRAALPGVVLSIVDDADRAVDVGATNVDGTFTLKIPAAGHYTLKAELSAFAPETRALTVDAANCRPRVEVAMTLASRAPASTAGPASSVGSPGSDGAAATR